MPSVQITKPCLRWLFGGIGFHNSEATMGALMSETFRNERAVKVFREISPTYSRVFAGYADWTREAMDAFADYYDETFRRAGTTLYLVPGRMPMPSEDTDIAAYAEKVAANLEYLIRERGCTKIRHYCVTNELSCGNTYAYLAKHLDLFKQYHEALAAAFRRHGLDIGLLATDCSGLAPIAEQIPWAIANMDEVTECYCGHLYTGDFIPGELSQYAKLYEAFSAPVQLALKKEKRFLLGEFGINAPNKWARDTMRNDVSYGVDRPDEAGRYAIALCEMALAAMNAGCLAAVQWTMVDYPDPLLREDGDTPEEKARYDAARFSGHGLNIRYNKNGLIRWCDDEADYRGYPSLHTMGHMARLFRKGARLLRVDWDDEALRGGAVTNPDGSMSVLLINWADAPKEITVSCAHPIDKPLRRYVFDSANPPDGTFCDLMPWEGLTEAENGSFTLTMPPASLAILTTDYIDRKPSPAANVRVENGMVTWDACTDAEHCYYRVYRGGEQIASTVAEHAKACGEGVYTVRCVDRYGNISD